MQQLRTFICTLGFEESRVLTIIPTFGIQNGDKIILITVSDKTGRSNQAKSVLKQLMESFQQAGGEIALESIEINELDFDNNVVIFCNIIREEAQNKRKVIINLSGGMKIIGIALFLASLLSKKYISSVSIRPENSKELVEISYPQIEIGLNEKELKILELIAAKKSVKEMTEILELNRSTIYRYFTTLKNRGYLKEYTRATSEVLQLTIKGQIVLLDIEFQI